MYPPPGSAGQHPRQLRPYLGPRAHISLSWLSQSFLALVLLAMSLSILLANVHYFVSDAEESYASACQGVQGAANVLVSLPHYTADGINEMNSKSVTAITHGAAEVLDFALLSVESIAIFIVDMYRSLYLCLLELAVHGSLDLLISAFQEAEAFITSAFQEVRSGVQDAIGGVEKALDESIALINKLPGVDITAPQLDVPSLDVLKNVTIPSTLVSSLEKLNSTIPTLGSFRATLDSLISTPIDALRALVNTTLANATIDVELLPVPAKSSVDLCGSLDTGFIDDVGNDIARLLKIGLGLLGLAAALLILANALWERYRYRMFLEGVSRARQAWQIDMGDKKSLDETLSTPSLLSFLSASHHPTISLWLARVAVWFRLSPEHRASMYWFMAYICHPTAIILLFLGLFGIVVIQIQLALLEGPIKKAVQAKAADSASDFSAQVLATVNSNLNSTSVEFAQASNKVVETLQNGINNELFGWVNTTTTAMNNTLNSFYDGLTSTVSDFFSGTPLENIALDFVYCVIGSKVVGMEEALKFIHNNAHIALPTMSNSVLMLSPNRTADLTSDMTSPNSSLSTTSIVERIVDRYAESLRQQRLGFIVCLVIWVVVVLMGLYGVFWTLRGKEIWSKRRRVQRLKKFPTTEEKHDLRTYQLRQDSAPSPPPLSSLNTSTPSSNMPRRDPVGMGSTWNAFTERLAHPPSLKVPRTHSFSSPSLPSLPKLSKQLPKPAMPAFPWFERDIGEPDYYRRRNSDTMDLRSGLQLDRALPSQSKTVGLFRSAVSIMKRAARSKGQRDPGKLGRNGSLTSMGPRREEEDEDDYIGDDWEDQEVLAPFTVPPRPSNPFLGLQDPLSPPPIPSSQPSAFVQPPSFSLVPLISSTVHTGPPNRQPSSY